MLTVRPIARRLQRIATTSRAFAQGHLEVRTGDLAADEIGQLGRQFDSMAQVISRQVGELRTLAEHNSVLTVELERNARAAERTMLSRDLHDAISQHLFSLAMGTADLATHIRRNPEQAAGQAEQLADIAAQAQDALRAMLLQLRYAEAADRNLRASIAEMTEKLSRRYSIEVHTQIQIDTRPIPLLIEDVVYRVCQEALNNVVRHANAKRVHLSILQRPYDLYASIIDDGHGFDTRTTTSGLGIIGMSERVRAIGGTLLVTSAPGKGTHVAVCIAQTPAEEVDHGGDRVISGRPRNCSPRAADVVIGTGRYRDRWRGGRWSAGSSTGSRACAAGGADGLVAAPVEWHGGDTPDYWIGGAECGGGVDIHGSAAADSSGNSGRSDGLRAQGNPCARIDCGYSPCRTRPTHSGPACCRCVARGFGPRRRTRQSHAAGTGSFACARTRLYNAQIAACIYY
ncbi:sensor histidine kinase [Candidatus Gracilibacteria bacterium]|nr:sensor histidine kinase [Candidatus Gracilibacteria bacterium]